MLHFILLLLQVTSAIHVHQLATLTSQKTPTETELLQRGFVTLLGTCGTSTWRQEFFTEGKPYFKPAREGGKSIGVFNPQSAPDSWKDEFMVTERLAKDDATINFMHLVTGQASPASRIEAIAYCYGRGVTTPFVLAYKPPAEIAVAETESDAVESIDLKARAEELEQKYKAALKGHTRGWKYMKEQLTHQKLIANELSSDGKTQGFTGTAVPTLASLVNDYFKALTENKVLVQPAELQLGDSPLKNVNDLAEGDLPDYVQALASAVNDLNKRMYNFRSAVHKIFTSAQKQEKKRDACYLFDDVKTAKEKVEDLWPTVDHKVPTTETIEAILAMHKDTMAYAKTQTTA